MKRILSVLLALLLVLPHSSAFGVAYDPETSYETIEARFWEDNAPPIGFYINSANRYILETVTAPRMGSTFGEWSVMDLLRGMYTGYDYLNHIPPQYFDDYYDRINGYVIANEGDLDRNKSTEWSRLTLSMSALGKDIRQMGKPGEYIKTISAIKEGDEWKFETNNNFSISAVPIINGKIQVNEPVGIKTSGGKYSLFQEGTYPIERNGQQISITAPTGKVILESTQYVNITKSYNFVERMSQSHRFSYRQGINGPIWVIVAMNTGQYKLVDEKILASQGISVAANDLNTVGKMIDYILQREIKTVEGELGGWALTGNKPDPDITGMALQALAPYYLDESKFKNTGSTSHFKDFKLAVERAVVTLNSLQKPNGGYESWGSINAESIVQVIVALAALQMDPMKEVELPTLNKTISFVKEGAYADGVWTNNMIDALLTFYAAGSGSSPEVGGFKHVTTGYDGGGGSGTSVNAMATDQALYGLIAYDRFLKGLSPLYDMTDMINGEYKQMKANTYTITWVDGEQKTVQKVSPYALIDIPSNIKAWNSEKSLQGTRYLAGEKLIMPEQNITLYADHKPQTVNVATVQRVISLINELPSKEELKKDHKNAVDRAMGAYKKLNEEEQQKVTNTAKLLELEGLLSAMLSQFDDELKIINLIQTIDHLMQVPTISSDYAIAITNARHAFLALNAEQRQLITNRADLDTLQAKLAASIEIEQGKKITVESVKQAINNLPTVNSITLQHAEQIFKIQAYIELLLPQQQSTLDQQALHKAIEIIRQLQQQALQIEQLEDELNSNSFGSLTVIGKTLHVTASRTTGEFKIQIEAEALRKALAKSVEHVVFSDVRGVQLKMTKQALLNQINEASGNIVLSVSQLQNKKQIFEVKWELASGHILESDQYIQLTIPLNYFITGHNIEGKLLVKYGEQKLATAHTIQKNSVTISMFKGAKYEFVENDFSFTDAPLSASTEHLYYLANRLVVNGQANGKFNPNASITRGQFAAMVNRALGLEAKSPSPFNDITNQWYAKDVQALAEAGIVKGVNATTFNPSGKLTRQQAAIMMARILNYVEFPLEQYASGLAYKDHASISKEAQTSVYSLKNLGVMTGANNTFNPGKPLTRLQMTKILRQTLAIAQLM